MRIAAAAYPLDFLPDWNAYEAKITAWVDDAVAQGAQLVVFPEYGAMELASLGGAAVAADLQAATAEVIRHSDAVRVLHSGLAARHGLYILGASGPADAGLARPVNRAVFYGPGGVIGHQDKQIMTRFEREHWDIAPGAEGLALFHTAIGKVGVVICYDAEFPLLARSLARAGVEILLAPSCTEAMAGYSRVRIGAMARALENQCIAVHAPTVGAAPWCPAVDVSTGAAAIYGPPDRGFHDTGIMAIGALDAPGWVLADVSLESVAQVRADGQVLNLRHWTQSDKCSLIPLRHHGDDNSS